MRRRWNDRDNRLYAGLVLPTRTALKRMRSVKLSTKSLYGLRAMLHMALSPKEGVIMSRGIAESENLPETYLEQLMLSLRKAGLLSATRGSRGGYMLTKSPKDITLAEIVEALEGPLKIVNCTDVPNCCNGPGSCALKDVFDEVNDALYSAMNNISLGDIADRQRTNLTDYAPMYHI